MMKYKAQIIELFDVDVVRRVWHKPDDREIRIMDTEGRAMMFSGGIHDIFGRG